MNPAEQNLINAIAKHLEAKSKDEDLKAGKIAFKFTAEQVYVLRKALLNYNTPENTSICTELFELLGDRLRELNERDLKGDMNE